MRQRKYDIAAKVPPGITMADTRVMLQNLLIARLRLKMHHETRPLPGYEVVVAKSGAKMKEAAAPDAGEAPRDGLGITMVWA